MLCLLYVEETLTLTEADRQTLEAFEMWTWRWMENIDYVDKVANDDVLKKVNRDRQILYIFRQWQHWWISHIVRGDGLPHETATWSVCVVLGWAAEDRQGVRGCVVLGWAAADRQGWRGCVVLGWAAADRQGVRGCVALGWAAEDRQGWRHRKLVSKTCSTAENYWWLGQHSWMSFTCQMIVNTSISSL